MHLSLKSHNLKKFTRTRGEIYVWLSSMGLSIGLGMVVFLLWLILSNGFSVFWPKRVVEIELKLLCFVV